MAKKVYEESNIQAIADAIREKTGGDTTYTTAEMPGGVNEVYKVGRDAGLVAMWESLQDGGNRRVYDFLFYFGNPDVFYPKYDIITAGDRGDGGVAGLAIFRDFGRHQEKILDLTERLAECGVVLNTNASKSFLYFMLNAWFTRIPTIDLSNCSSMYMSFYNSKIETIDGLILKADGTTPFTPTAFQYCSYLKEITKIEGVIGVNIAFQNSPLNVATMNRIIVALKDYSGTTGTHTLTLKADRQNMLTAAEKAVATNKGWTLVWS